MASSKTEDGTGREKGSELPRDLKLLYEFGKERGLIENADGR